MGTENLSKDELKIITDWLGLDEVALKMINGGMRGSAFNPSASWEDAGVIIERLLKNGIRVHFGSVDGQCCASLHQGFGHMVATGDNHLLALNTVLIESLKEGFS